MRIGTRASRLALAQARWVAQRIGNAELVEITTAGDRGTGIADKSRWTSELERALIEGRIDLAVHSAKDVPADLAAGTSIVAVPPREDAADALVGAPSLAALGPGARVGTVSLRRGAQLRSLHPHLQIVELRGNVDTRLRKLHEGEADALVLAVAGLRRLGRADAVGMRLEELIPAAGQGALALQACDELAGDPRLDPVRDRDAERELRVERELVGTLAATCLSPIGIHAQAIDGERLRLRTWIGMPDGSSWLRDELTGIDERLALDAAERLRAAGAEELLQAAERSLAA